MTEIRLEYPPDEAREVVKEALRRTHGISSIEESPRQIVGKTGISFPRVLWSWGENVYVDFPDSPDENVVLIEVWAEKAIWMNIFADPQKFKRRFLSTLEELRGQSVEDIRTQPISHIPQGHSANDDSGLTVFSINLNQLSIIFGVTFIWMIIIGMTGIFGKNPGPIGLIVFLALLFAPGAYLWSNYSSS